MLSPTELKIADGVARNGWYVVNYFPKPGEPAPALNFSYTVGLAKTAGWPEIILFGFDPERAYALIGALLQGCWNKGQPPVAGMTVEGLVRDMPVKLIAFDDPGPRYFQFADWYARHIAIARPRRLQLIWPDANGILPDDPRCDAEVRAQQNMGAGA